MSSLQYLWSGPAQISNFSTSAAPAICGIGLGLVMAWKDDSTNELKYATYSEGSWGAAAIIPSDLTSDSPALAEYEAALYMAWKGYNDDRLWYAKYGELVWNGQVQIPGASTSCAPALATYGGKLYAAWKNSGDNTLWYSTYTGGSWSSPSILPGCLTSDSPALSTTSGGLFLSFKGYDDDRLWYSIYNGTFFSPQAQVPNALSTNGPATTGIGDKLVMAWKGHDDNSIWYSTFNGTSWEGQAWDSQSQIPDVDTSDSPALGVYNQRVLMAFKGKGDSTGIWSDWHYVTNASQEHNIVLTSLGASLGQTSTNGVLYNEFGEGVPFVGTGHIQGMSLYKNYVIFTLDNLSPSNDDPGYFVIGDTFTGDTQHYPIPTELKYRHPSGFQVIGDFAVVGVEMSDTDNNNAYVLFYDLRTVTPSAGPTLLAKSSFYRAGSGAAASGMTFSGGVYTLAVYATKTNLVYVYRSSPGQSLGGDSLVFGESWSFSPAIAGGAVASFNNLGLFTDVAGEIYLFGFRSDSKDATYYDYLDVFQIGANSATFLSSTHYISDTGGTGITGPHFRYGAGATAMASDYVSLCCSARSFVPPSTTYLDGFWAKQNS